MIWKALLDNPKLLKIVVPFFTDKTNRSSKISLKSDRILFEDHKLDEKLIFLYENSVEALKIKPKPFILGDISNLINAVEADGSNNW